MEETHVMCESRFQIFSNNEIFSERMFLITFFLKMFTMKFRTII